MITLAGVGYSSFSLKGERVKAEWWEWVGGNLGSFETIYEFSPSVSSLQVFSARPS